MDELELWDVNAVQHNGESMCRRGVTLDPSCPIENDQHSIPSAAVTMTRTNTLDFH